MLPLLYDVAVINTEDRDASCSLGVRMYTRYAELDHRPNICIVAYPKPHACAVVAAPILKEWPA